MLSATVSLEEALNGCPARFVRRDFTALEARHPALRAFRERLGNTPLVPAPNPAGGALVLAKLEMRNPAGSIKDRVAYALICDALLARPEREPGDLTVLEYSGGNLALGMSALGQTLGLRMRFVLSEASPASLLDTLRSRGAAVHLSARDDGFLGVMREAFRLAEADPDLHFPFQHTNGVNLAFHCDTTGREILRQLAGRKPDAWVASVGTGGTLIGVLRALQQDFPDIRAVAVTPSELAYGSAQPPNARPKLGGSGGLGWGIRQPFVDRHAGDGLTHRTVSYPQALEGMRRYFDLTGMKIGTSAAANWLVATELAAGLPADACVVTVFPCAGQPGEWQAAGLSG